jgi:hypothetical protein
MNRVGTFYLRLGMTESTLLFYYWLFRVKKIELTVFPEVAESQNTLINWLFTTSGYYDTSIGGTYFNFNGKYCSGSLNYNRYMNSLLENIRDAEITLCWHNVSERVIKYKEEFINHISTYIRSLSPCNISTEEIFKRIVNKRILIINPMSSLMKQQYISGNLLHIYPNFPSVKEFHIYENKYTFFNKGPDGSIFETAEKVCDAISGIDFDIAIVSCGAYSSVIGNYINTVLCKDVITLGGDLLSIFGIKTGRNNNGPFNEYWVSVPDHLKPKDYMKIEDGCYW